MDNNEFTQTAIPHTKNIYAIYDRARQAFLEPMTKPNHRCALRDWEKLCNTPECMISICPDDYALYYIGTFDEQTGVLDNALTKIAEASDYKEGYTPKNNVKKGGAKKNVRKKS